MIKYNIFASKAIKMDTVSIEIKTAQELYDKSSQEIREVLQQLIPGKLKDDIFERCTTLEAIFIEAGVEASNYAITTGMDKRKRNSLRRDVCALICEVLNEGIELDFNNKNQTKYYLWGNNPGSGFVLCAVDYDNTLTYVGACLSFVSDRAARHAWEHFSQCWIDMWEGK